MPEKYRYRCPDPGDVRDHCEFEYEHEDRERVREEATEHRRLVHRIDDTDPEVLNGLIEMVRIQV